MIAISSMVTGGHPATSGASETARFVSRQVVAGRSRLQNTFSLGAGRRDVLESLYQTAEECRQPNWDGYKAEPVRGETFTYAYRFLEALPLGVSAPTVGVEADGHLTLEWYRSPERVLSVSISPEGILYYAALLGLSKRSGTEPFFGEVPGEILQIITRLFPT